MYIYIYIYIYIYLHILYANKCRYMARKYPVAGLIMGTTFLESFITLHYYNNLSKLRESLNK